MLSGGYFSLMSIVRSIREVGKNITFDISENDTNEFEADGTGLPILQSGKRGKELKVLAQRKKGGGIRMAGIALGSYKSGWDIVFSPIKEIIKKMKKIVLITDGDTSILKGLKGVKVILQRCLFHIPHELKYTLWRDGVKRKSTEWIHILSEAIGIVTFKREKEDEKVADSILEKKENQFEGLIKYCDEMKLKRTTSFLKKTLRMIYLLG